MRDDVIEERVYKEAYYIAQTGETVRNTAKIFMVSKSTVHKDVTERLSKMNKTLYAQVKIALEKNLAERHIRGGEATKLKFKGKTKNRVAIK
ncbi:MAG: sporulation transcriptional regulator SpoIIID [Clostridia bacterium]|nr:sporulation transcriptional regulator SpoIIID [Clostridia bacterium]